MIEGRVGLVGCGGGRRSEDDLAREARFVGGQVGEPGDEGAVRRSWGQGIRSSKGHGIGSVGRIDWRFVRSKHCGGEQEWSLGHRGWPVGMTSRSLRGWPGGAAGGHQGRHAAAVARAIGDLGGQRGDVDAAARDVGDPAVGGNRVGGVGVGLEGPVRVVGGEVS